MVRKVIGFFSVMLLLLCGAAATASAESVYEGTISSTYTSLAEQIYISPFDDYVFFRSGQYSYKLVVGDLEYNDHQFSLSENGQVYTITQVNSGFGSSSYYSYTVSYVSSFSLSTNDCLVYSNLGGYPILNSNSDLYFFVIVVLLSVISICLLIRPVFNFVMRFRYG